ncbi:MAG TPA: phosphotransferase [Anaerolineales bacterium]|nr:phosphotransferase [Anaerolineales bacterium]
MKENLGPKLAEGRTAEVFAWGEDWVVKLYREGWTRETAAYEYNQAIASQHTGFSVPQVQQMVEIDGRFGIIYERIEGTSMWDTLHQHPFQLSNQARLMADLHLDMHTRRADGMQTSQETLSQKINQAKGLSQPLKDQILAHSAELPFERRLLHGDFHPENILLTETGPMIIDWVDGNIGHPLADVARTIVLGTVGIPPSEKANRLFFRLFLSTYLRRYFKSSPYARKELNRWLLPVAAGRLSEEIPHEKEALIRWVTKLAAKQR